ncbi:MAG: ATP-dependent DNA helicase RecG [Proteobacteria bacterium]|nr:ATP-dependent DNA helicase RecG [Pseudomonadota bacterium]
MTPSPYQTAMAALVRPLEFAARDDFAQLDRVRDLEATVREALARLRALALPEDARRALVRVEKAFAGPPVGEGLRAAVARSLEAVAPFADPAFPAAALARPLTVLPGIGPARADRLAARGLESVGDLLYRLPSRYDDRRRLVPVGELEVGRRATFEAEVLVADFVSTRVRGRFKRVLQAVVGDDTGTVQLKWFQGGEAVGQSVRKGARLLVTGLVKRYRFTKELVHPEVERLPDADDGPETPRRVVPDYSSPEGLPARTLRGWVGRAVSQYADLLPGYLPAAFAQDEGLPEPAAAVRQIHAPGAEADPDDLRERRTPAHRRLVLEELYLLELGLLLRRRGRRQLQGVAVDVDTEPGRRAARELPFSFTQAQRRAWGEIRADLARAEPMQRLLQGDVGSGKTAVAFVAATAVAGAGHQTAIMAPTELLAEQHARTLERLAAGQPEARRLRLELLTSSRRRAEARRILEALAAGRIDCVVGTHALVQEDVRFRSLALAVVDEQHRFGVAQRAALSAKGPGGRVPHTLVMTATPIPRTLALTVYGDLDLSVIDELPPGRQPVKTRVLRAGEGRRILELVRETLARGEQVYVVYPLVEESEKVDLRAAQESAERIRAALPETRVDLVHGRLDAAERARAMARFESGETGLLVSTTVIEVGVDVPAATLMVVEHAERFGLAQLHQLRGRVGRGDRPGTCLLVARAVTEDSEARLEAMVATTDGFRIADADLRIRGPGEFLGTRQSGHLPNLRVADLVRDARWVAAARQVAEETLERDADLRRDPELRRAVEARWGERLALSRVG